MNNAETANIYEHFLDRLEPAEAIRSPHWKRARWQRSGLIGAGPSAARAAVRGAPKKEFAKATVRPISDVYNLEPHMGALYNYWRELRYKQRRLPSIEDVSPIRLNEIAPGNFHCYLHNQGSFKAIHCASAAKKHGADLTGLHVAEYPASVYAQFLQENFMRSMLVGSPTLAGIEAYILGPSGPEDRKYDWLFLPLCGGSRERFLVGVGH